MAQMVEMHSADQETLIRQLSDQLMPPDVLIVDTGAGIDQTVQTFVAACQTAVLVVCDEPASLTDAYALMKVLRAKKNVRRFEILANQVDTPIQGKQLFERIANVCDRYLDVELGYLGGIPTDMYLRRAVQERKAVVSAYPRSPAANAIRDAGRRLNRQGTTQSKLRRRFFRRAAFESTNSCGSALKLCYLSMRCIRVNRPITSSTSICHW